MLKIIRKKEVDMPQFENLKVIISGGGTGGHVFPAIAIANAIKNREPGAKILFIGAKGRMEMEKVPAAGYHILGLNISGLQRRLTLKNFLVPFKAIDSYIRARNIVKRFRPDVVVGVGGYASGPMLRAASSLGVPTVIQEQNSYPGLTNKMLAKKAHKICVAYDGLERFFPKEKIFLTGNPVRQDIINIEGKREEALQFFGLSDEKKILLIIGGSLGARSINESIVEHLRLFISKDIQVIWQTGKYFYPQAESFAKEFQNSGVRVYPFINRMDLAYAAASMVVSRAGAIAVSEICAVRIPAILVPSPNVTEDHQTKNAMALVNFQAATLVKDIEAKQQLGPVVVELIEDEIRMHRQKEKMASFAFRDSADMIASVVFSVITKTA